MLTIVLVVLCVVFLALSAPPITIQGKEWCFWLAVVCLALLEILPKVARV